VDWATVLAILATGFLGFPVSAITEMLKRTLRKYLKLPDAAWVGYIAAAVACALSSWAVLSQMGKGSLINIGLATFLCWIVANGFYKETAAKPAEHAAAAVEDLTKDVMIAVRSEVSTAMSKAVSQSLWKAVEKSRPPTMDEGAKPIKPTGGF
jgi:hypothetical protein